MNSCIYVYKRRCPEKKAPRLRYGELRSVGSIKLCVSFAKGTCERDYILQKRPTL